MNQAHAPHRHSHQQQQHHGGASFIELDSSVQVQRATHGDKHATQQQQEEDDGVADLVRQAEASMKANSKLVSQLGRARHKLTALDAEFKAIARSDEHDAATMALEERLLSALHPQQQRQHHDSDSADDSEQDLSSTTDDASAAGQIDMLQESDTSASKASAGHHHRKLHPRRRRHHRSD